MEEKYIEYIIDEKSYPLVPEAYSSLVKQAFLGEDEDTEDLFDIYSEMIDTYYDELLPEEKEILEPILEKAKGEFPETAPIQTQLKAGLMDYCFYYRSHQEDLGPIRSPKELLYTAAPKLRVAAYGSQDMMRKPTLSKTLITTIPVKYRILSRDMHAMAAFMELLFKRF